MVLSAARRDGACGNRSGLAELLKTLPSLSDFRQATGDGFALPGSRGMFHAYGDAVKFRSRNVRGRSLELVDEPRETREIARGEALLDLGDFDGQSLLEACQQTLGELDAPHATAHELIEVER